MLKMADACKTIETTPNNLLAERFLEQLEELSVGTCIRKEDVVTSPTLQEQIILFTIQNFQIMRIKSYRLDMLQRNVKNYTSINLSSITLSVKNLV